MGLQTYRAKRNFKVTPEPRGAKKAAAGHAFVIQKHAARRLHYDLRLELDGVMKSWAVTRGPSLIPGEKRLAVQVEDHPIEYNSFEGTIPQGEYGGGTVMIWDRGVWFPDGNPHQGLKKGRLTFTLDGAKLKGLWHLIRMRGRPGEARANWLLVKAHDEAARGENDPDILEEMPLSVVSGRSIPQIAEGKGTQARVAFEPERFEEPGSVLLSHACRMGLEGIISKRRNARYRPGRGGDWLKTKCSDRQEFVVAGYAPSSVDREAVGALILGYYDNGALRYAGRSGTGYTHKVARELWRRLQPLRTETPPFDQVPKEETRSRYAQWVEPRLVVEVDFRGWTHGDRVRQASFQGIREDKSPKEIVRETKVMPPAGRKSAAAATRASVVRAPRAEQTTTSSTPYSVRMTHPDRMYWEDAGVTKQGLADYYVEVWDWIAPHVVGRPLALVRCPEGATGECFFQKHASAGIERKWLRLVREPDGDHVITIDDLDGLISLAQAGVLEIHTRGTTADKLETADRLVFDLDPGPGIGWSDLVKAARDVRRHLADLGLIAFLKTSGGKGLHVVLPIRPAPWDTAKAFARSIAEAMVVAEPSRYTATVKKSSRKKRIFVDYLRNSREATAVAPYSTRARPGAPVSTPLSWEELGTVTSADRYSVLNLPQRLARLRKDPWADIASLKQALPTQ